MNIPESTKTASEESAKKPKFTVEQILLEHPLYNEVDLAQFDNVAMGNSLLDPTGTINAPCSQCAEGHSIFALSSSGKPGLQDWGNEFYFTIFARCTRNKDHSMNFRLRINGDKVQKVGQYPSHAELNIKAIKGYSKVLPPIALQEMVRAIGLAAHGVGVGSFVYLRRIFEGLVEEAHQKAKHEEGWDDVVYQKAKIPEKVELLSSHLPAFLVENKILYGIMSKGVHELSEEECLAIFPSVKLAIEIILDAKLEEKQRTDKLRAAKAELQKWHSTLKGVPEKG